METIYVTEVPVVQWNTKDLDGILDAGNGLYVKIPKAHKYLLVTDTGYNVTKYGQGYNIEIWKGMFGSFAEEVDKVIGMKLSGAVKSMTKENEWAYGIFHIRCLATASASALILQKDKYYIFDPHGRNTYIRPIDGGTSMLLQFN